MRIPKSTFLIFSLALTAGLLWVYGVFVNHFDKKPEAQFALSNLERELEEERLEKSLLAYQLQDLQQSVAAVLPSQKQKISSLMSQGISSAVRSPSSLEPVNLSSSLYESLKQSFKSKQWDQVISKSKQMIDQYPTSIYLVNAYFFMAETYFLKKDFNRCSETVDLMVDQFPDHELTGFILLRLGQMSEANNQVEVAREIYATVETQFRSEALRHQARQMQKALQ